MARNLIWLSFDLGIQGDYESLYAWLDSHKAKECGDNVASLWYEHEGDIVEALQADLKENVQLTRKSRFYVISNVDGLKGSFVLGNRKSAPWAGFSGSEVGEDTDRA